MARRRAWPTPVPVRRALARFGQDIATWRKLNQLTQEQVADRAGVTRPTLVALEHGEGGVSIENVFRIARALGVLDPLAASIDPHASGAGQLRSDQLLPQRVRKPRG